MCDGYGRRWAAEGDILLCKSVLSRRDCGGKNAAVGIDCEVARPETSL